jgi:hypothetical protein
VAATAGDVLEARLPKMDVGAAGDRYSTCADALEAAAADPALRTANDHERARLVT